MKELKTPKTVKKLSDADHARALHAFIMNDADIDATYSALNKKHSKATLKWYAERFRWDLRHEEARNDLISDAVEDAKQRRKLDLLILRDTKSRVVSQIRDGTQRIVGDKVIVMQLRAKTLGEAVSALRDIIRLEREIAGNTDGADSDRAPSLLEHLVTAVKSGYEDQLDDRGNGGKGNGRRAQNRIKKKAESAEKSDDDPFNIR